MQNELFILCCNLCNTVHPPIMKPSPSVPLLLPLLIPELTSSIPLDILLISAPLLPDTVSHTSNPSCNRLQLAPLCRWRLKQMHTASRRETQDCDSL